MKPYLIFLVMASIVLLAAACAPINKSPASDKVLATQKDTAAVNSDVKPTVNQGDQASEAQPSPSSPVPSVPSENISPFADSCKDEDGGINPAVHGSAIRFYKGTKTEFADRCNGKILIEHYCDKNYMRTQEFECIGTCEEGSCPYGFAAPRGYDIHVEDSGEASDDEDDSDSPNIMDPSKQFYNCFNVFRDTYETDVDCGGSECQGCGFGKRCNVNSDCSEPLVCNIRSKKCSDFKH